MPNSNETKHSCLPQPSGLPNMQVMVDGKFIDLDRVPTAYELHLNGSLDDLAKMQAKLDQFSEQFGSDNNIPKNQVKLTDLFLYHALLPQG